MAFFGMPPYNPGEENSDDEDVELDASIYRRRIHPFTEFTEIQFRRRYRVTKAIAAQLVDGYSQHVPLMGGRQGNAVPLEDKVCLALRYLATGSNYSLVADYQGVSIPTVSRAVSTFTDFLYDESYKYILWPETLPEKEAIVRDFYEQYGYPRVLGCIDGSHIAIRKPLLNEAAYVNRKGWHSLNAMFVCNGDMVFTHVNASWPGSVHDSYAYNSSAIKVQADLHQLDPFFLLGDSGYGCQANLFTPVDHPLMDSEIDYNVWHRMTRSLVERAIGALKNRWRCLDTHGGILYHQPARAAKIVTSCTALQNICLRAHVPLDLDHDRDGYQHQQDRQQPEDLYMGANVTGRRTQYIANNFTL